MLQSSDVIAFVSTTDLDRGRDFYERILGLRVTEKSSFACVFDAHGTMLRLTAAATVATPGYTVLGWKVTDIAAAVADLAASGVAVNRYEGMDQDADGIWTTPSGDRVAWFHDPDGNILSVTQFFTAST